MTNEQKELLKQRVDAVIKGDVGHPAISAVLPDCCNFVADFEEILNSESAESFVQQLEAAGVVENAKLNQQQINLDNQVFLDNSDWKILRHIRQIALGIQTSLTQEQYLALEQERQDKAQAITH